MSESLGDILAHGRHTVLMNVRPNTVLAIAGVLVAALALVAVLLSAQRQHTDFDEDTPEGVAQLYVVSLIKGNDEVALRLLDPELGCSLPLETYTPAQASIVLVSSEVDSASTSLSNNGDTATVVLDITELDSGSPSWSHRETFELSKTDGNWRIVGEPWPVYGCE